MPATPSRPHRSVPLPSSHDPACVSLEERWNALQLKAGEIATLADLGEEQNGETREAFAHYLARADERAAAVAERGLEDMELLAAIGLKALTEVQARHKDAHAPALALWRELYHAREAVLSVLEPVPA